MKKQILDILRCPNCKQTLVEAEEWLQEEQKAYHLILFIIERCKSISIQSPIGVGFE